MREARLLLESAQFVADNATSLLASIKGVAGYTEQQTTVGQDKETNEKNTEVTIRPVKESHCSTLDSEPSSTKIRMNGFEFFHCNLNGFVTNSARVVAAIRLRAKVPHVVFLNETKTDAGDKNFQLEGFVKIHKKDRCKGGGGIAVFARRDIATRVTLLDEESVDERCWITIHSDEGPYLGCCWYRPGTGGETQSITRFGEELQRLRQTVIGTIIIGDLNVHSTRWLRHSTTNSAANTLLQNLCNEMGLKQYQRANAR